MGWGSGINPNIFFNITGSSGGGIKLDPGRTYYINIRNIDFDTGQDQLHDEHLQRAHDGEHAALTARSRPPAAQDERQGRSAGDAPVALRDAACVRAKLVSPPPSRESGSPMSVETALTALSPLDGRYAAKLEPLREHFSEFGLVRARVRVEIAWLLALGDEPAIAEVPPFAEAARDALLRAGREFSVADAARVKTIERTTNHDVKAVEYWLKERFAGVRGVAEYAEFIHFACTSEDINNLAHAIALDEARRLVLLPALSGLQQDLRALAHANAAQPMLSRTHGQPATPTTLGKEMANFAARLARADRRLRARADEGEDERRRGQLQRARRRLPGRGLGAARRPRRRRLRAGAQPLHHADRAARRDGRVLRRARAREHRARRPRPRRLGLHLAGVLPPAREGGRGRVLDDAAQGEPDRLREFRGQPRRGERAAAPPRGQAAGVALAARPDRLDRAAQHGGRARATRCSAGSRCGRGSPSSTSTPRASPPISTPTGRCSPNRSRP